MTTPTSLRLSDDLSERVDREVEARGRSRSQTLIELIQEGLDGSEPNQIAVHPQGDLRLWIEARSRMKKMTEPQYVLHLLMHIRRQLIAQEQDPELRERARAVVR